MYMYYDSIDVFFLALTSYYRYTPTPTIAVIVAIIMLQPPFEDELFYTSALLALS